MHALKGVNAETLHVIPRVHANRRTKWCDKCRPSHGQRSVRLPAGRPKSRVPVDRRIRWYYNSLSWSCRYTQRLGAWVVLYLPGEARQACSERLSCSHISLLALSRLFTSIASITACAFFVFNKKHICESSFCQKSVCIFCLLVLFLVLV
jgi:hypothetical protein